MAYSFRTGLFLGPVMMKLVVDHPTIGSLNLYVGSTISSKAVTMSVLNGGVRPRPHMWCVNPPDTALCAIPIALCGSIIRVFLQLLFIAATYRGSSRVWMYIISQLNVLWPSFLVLALSVCVRALVQLFMNAGVTISRLASSYVLNSIVHPLGVGS